MYSNSSCTIFLYSNKYQKVVIPHCFLTHREIASYSKPGMTYEETAFVMAKLDADVTFSKGKDLLVEGTTDLTIDTTSETTISNSKKSLFAAMPVYTIMQADKKEYGSGSMRHVEISCR